MVMMSQVGTSNHQITGSVSDPLLKLNYMQLCNNSYNGIKLALIGSSDSDALPELVELVSTHAKCVCKCNPESNNYSDSTEQVELVNAQSVRI